MDIREISREFTENGIVRINKLLPEPGVEMASNEVMARLESKDLYKNGKWDKSKMGKISFPIGVSQLIGRISNETVFGDLITPELMEIIQYLSQSEPLFSPVQNGQVLITLPNAKDWMVSHDNWHLDISRLPGIGLPGIQVFTFLLPVPPRGGGTLAVRGSHQLLNQGVRISSKQVRNRLKKIPYFRALMDPNGPDRNIFLHEEGSVENIRLKVVEIHGNPCDVYLMDMRLLHTASLNAAEIPRIMWTKRYFTKRAHAAMYGVKATQ